MPQTIPTPDVPDYVLDAVDARDPDELDALGDYCRHLADHKRTQADTTSDGESTADSDVEREERGLSDEHKEAFAEQDYSDDPDDYEGVPDNAYRTVKTIDGNDYFYWQWRSSSDKDAPDKNKYIGPAGGGE